MARDEEGTDLGPMPIYALDGAIIGEVTRLSYVVRMIDNQEIVDEIKVEVRIDADPTRVKYGFTGPASMRVPL